VKTRMNSPSCCISTFCVAIFSTPSRNVCHDAHHLAGQPHAVGRHTGQVGNRDVQRRHNGYRNAEERLLLARLVTADLARVDVCGPRQFGL
jgi:hypothetical protein